jgi:hypothetical protein
MTCTHKKTFDSVDVKRRPIRTCSSCGHRFVCLICNDTHKMWHAGLERDVPCTRCPKPCKKCRAGGVGAYRAHTPCRCACHDPEHYSYWNGLCPARKHGLDVEGQPCDLCAREAKDREVVIYGDDDTLELLKKINKALATKGLVLADRSKDGADHCVYVLEDVSK